MSSIGTRTSTFTVVDIRKVVENFAADFSMMAYSTGLRTRESVDESVSDLKTLAENGYLISVKLILKNASGTQIRGAKYEVSESALGWTSGRPGGNLWPRTPGGTLKVVATLSRDWWGMSDSQKTSFLSRNGMFGSWDLTNEDTSFASLMPSVAQRYASNGYGWERINYG